MGTLLNGSNGNIALANRKGTLVTWSATMSGDVVPVTPYGNGGWDGNRRGSRRMSGSASGFMTSGETKGPGFNNTDFPAFSAGETCTFTADNGCSYTGIFVISDIKVVSASNTFPQVTFDFVSDGAVTETWASIS